MLAARHGITNGNRSWSRGCHRGPIVTAFIQQHNKMTADARTGAERMQEVRSRTFLLVDQHPSSTKDDDERTLCWEGYVRPGSHRREGRAGCGALAKRDVAQKMWKATTKCDSTKRINVPRPAATQRSVTPAREALCKVAIRVEAGRDPTENPMFQCATGRQLKGRGKTSKSSLFAQQQHLER